MGGDPESKGAQSRSQGAFVTGLFAELQRPPEGNLRPAGLQQSHHARKQAKKLLDYD